MDYKGKYLKYKTKYLKLIMNQNGGFLDELPIELYTEITKYLSEEDIANLRLAIKDKKLGEIPYILRLMIEKHEFDFEKARTLPQDIKLYVRKIKNVYDVTFNYENTDIKLKDIFPKLTHLTFSHWFNKKIEKGVLPELLTHLTFSQMFNHIIEKGVLPDSITHLTFGGYFNQKIEKGVLPKSLIHLAFGRWYNQKIEGEALPDSLKTIDIYTKDLIDVNTQKRFTIHETNPLADLPPFNPFAGRF